MKKYKWIYVPLFLIAEFIACAIIISFIPFEIPIWLATCFGIEMGLLGFIVAVVLCK